MRGPESFSGIADDTATGVSRRGFFVSCEGRTAGSTEVRKAYNVTCNIVVSITLDRIESLTLDINQAPADRRQQRCWLASGCRQQR